MLCQIIVSDQIVQDLTSEIMFYPLRPYCASLQDMDESDHNVPDQDQIIRNFAEARNLGEI